MFEVFFFAKKVPTQAQGASSLLSSLLLSASWMVVVLVLLEGNLLFINTVLSIPTTADHRDGLEVGGVHLCEGGELPHFPHNRWNGHNSQFY